MELLINLKRSGYNLLAIVLAALAGLTGISLAEQPVLLTSLLLIVWLLALGWALRSWWRRPRCVRLTDASLWIRVDNQWHAYATARVLPLLICFLTGDRKSSVVIWKDSVAPQAWRQLRMWLKIHSV